MNIRFAGLPKSYYSWILLALGLAIYISYQLPLALAPIQRCAQPDLDDDTYHYILKAQEMGECLGQDCPALRDLRRLLLIPPQLAVEPSVRRQADRGAQRILQVYHPLHSLVLLALRSAGLEWPGVFKWFSLGFSLLRPLILALFLAAWFGPTAGALALMMLAAAPLAPDNFAPWVPCLYLALLVWGLLRWRPGWSSWTVALGAPAIITMHIMGLPLSLATFVLAWACTRQHRPKGFWLGMAWGGLLVGAWKLLPLFVDHPLLTLDSPGYVRMVLSRLLGRAVWLEFLRSFQDTFGLGGAVWGVRLAWLSLVAGLAGLLWQRRWRTLLLGLVVAGTNFLAFMVVMRDFRAPLVFIRFWTLTAFYLAGLMGWAVYFWGARLVELFEDRDGVRRRLPLLAGSLAALVMAGAGTGAVLWHHGQRVEALEVALQRTLKRRNQTLDRKQPKRLLRLARPGDKVLYLQELPTYYYLSNGSLRLGAVLIRVARSRSLVDTWIKQNPDIRFVVLPNPIYKYHQARGMGIWLRKGDRFGLRLENRAPLGKVSTRLNNRGGAATLRITCDGGDGSSLIQLPPRSDRWLQVLPEDNGGCRELSLELVEGDGRQELLGIRLGDDRRGLAWPWNQQAVFFLQPVGQGKRECRFVGQGHCRILGKPIRILSDRGMSVLGEVIR